MITGRKVATAKEVLNAKGENLSQMRPMFEALIFLENEQRGLLSAHARKSEESFFVSPLSFMHCANALFLVLLNLATNLRRRIIL